MYMLDDMVTRLGFSRGIRVGSFLDKMSAANLVPDAEEIHGFYGKRETR